MAVDITVPTGGFIVVSVLRNWMFRIGVKKRFARVFAS